MTYPANSAAAVDPAKLDKLAEVAVRVGLQLQKGQDLVMTAPIAALPLARLITKHAYKAGAGLVSTFYADEEATLARYRHAPDASFDRATDWLYEGMATAFRNGAARLGIPSTARELDAWAARTSPWRSYLTAHLWRAPHAPAQETHP